MYANRTIEQTNQDLSDLIRLCTDQDIIVWGNLQKDGCTYDVHFWDDKMSICCCKNATNSRKLWFNDRLTSLTENEINIIHQANLAITLCVLLSPFYDTAQCIAVITYYPC